MPERNTVVDLTTFSDKALYMRSQIEEYWEGLKDRAIEKFDKGVTEHGDDYASLDYNSEIEKESIDLINYRIMEKHKDDMECGEVENEQD